MVKSDEFVLCARKTFWLSDMIWGCICFYFSFLCLEFFVLIEHFYSFGDVTMTYGGPQMLTYARHVWLLSSKGSLAWHTYCDTGLPFKMVISEDPWHSHVLISVWQWSCHYMYQFFRLRSVAAEIRTPNVPVAQPNLIGKLYLSVMFYDPNTH